MTGAENRDPYQILGVTSDADTNSIETAYRELARKNHPDLNPSPDATARMQDINWARDVLTDKTRRAQFDLERMRQRWRKSGTPGSQGQPYTRYSRTSGASGTSRTRPPGSTSHQEPRARPTGRYAGSTTGTSRPRTSPRSPGAGSSGTGAGSPGSTGASDPARPRSAPGDSTGPESRRAQEPRSRPTGRYQRPSSRSSWSSSRAGTMGRTPPRPGTAGRSSARTGATGRTSTRSDAPPHGAAGPDPASFGEQRAGPWRRTRDADGFAPGAGRTARPGDFSRRSASAAAGASVRGATTRTGDTSVPRPGWLAWLVDLGRDGLARASRFNRRMMGQYPAWASANAAGLRSVARFRRLDPRIQATAAAGAAMVCLLLLMWLIPDGAAGSAHAPVVVITPTPITVQVDGGLLQGEWITIWGDGYRALFQEQVTAAGSPMPVELGGMVFVPASDPTRGYYCPPPVAAVGAPAPLAPVALDGCVAIALPPRLAGTD